MTGCKKPQTVENLGCQKQANPVLIGLEFVTVASRQRAEFDDPTDLRTG